MRKRLLLAILMICLYTYTGAQTAKRQDSLLAELAKAKEDTNKMNLLIDISDVYFQQDLEVSKAYGQQVLDLAIKLHHELGTARANNLIGRCFAVQNNLPMALKYFHAALLTARKIKNPRLEAMLLSSISAVYTANSDFDKALKSALEAKAVNEKAGIKYMTSLMINIGYLYIGQNKMAEALRYYTEALRQEQAYGSDKTIGELANVYLNIGGVYIRMADYVPALDNYYKAEAILQQIGYTKNRTIAQADLGETYLRIAKGTSMKPLPDSLRNKNVCLDKAQYYLEQARAAGEKLDLIDVRSEVYASLADLYATRGQYEKAYMFKEMHTVLKDSLRDISREKEFAKIEADFLYRKKTDSLNYLNALKDKEIKRKKLERNGGIALITLTGVISLLFINRQKLKQVQKRKIAEADKQRVEELAKQQLDDFTKSIQEKNELIEKFSAEIEKYKTSHGSEASDEKDTSLQLLQSAVILNDEQWVNFQSLFNKVHTGYINRAKEKFSDLTTAELRFILLAKLGLTNKEMAAMLGVSSEAVRVSKHRLLKKIHLPDDTSLEEVVRSI